MKTKPTKAELAWAAGIFDGEGHVDVQCRMVKAGKKTYKNNFTSLISVGNIDGRILDRLKEILGGNIYYSCASSKRKLYVWRASGRNARLICLQLLPYLISKKEQIKLFIKFRKCVEKNIKFRPLTLKGKKARVGIANKIVALKWGLFPRPKYFKET